MNTYQGDRNQPRKKSSDYVYVILSSQILKLLYHKLKNCLNSRSSHQRYSIKKAVLKNFAIFTGKRLCLNLLLIKTYNFPRKRLRHRCFPVNIAQILITLILMKICEQLLLSFLLLTVNISS